MTQQEFEKTMAKAMPKWIPEKEDVANSMFESAQEMLLAVNDILVRHFKFKEDQIKSFNKHLEDMLKGLAEYEKYGFNILSGNSVEAIGDLVQTRLVKNKMTRVGMDYPILAEGKDFLLKINSSGEK